jgi:hypothetical protein
MSVECRAQPVDLSLQCRHPSVLDGAAAEQLHPRRRDLTGGLPVCSNSVPFLTALP